MRSGSLAYLLTLATDDTSVPDAELLARFAGNGDATAFELLVRRHADLVWRVCRCELPHDAHSAEDAFQTTFLVLARKAGSVRGSTVAGYLFRVARNAALRVRKRVGNVAETTVEIGVEPVEPNECSVAVIEEVERLPDKFRLPVLLCFFEDCTHVEAANRLGWAVGTVASRLARAKDRLRIRLTHRGVALPTILAGVSVPTATVRAAVMMATTPSAVPTLLTELSREVSIVMANAKAKWIGGGILAALILTSGVGMMTAGPGPEEPKPAAKDKPAAKVAETPEAAELKKLQGKWKVTRLETGRSIASAEEIEPIRCEIVGNTIFTINSREESQNMKMQIVLDLTKSPKQMMLTATRKPGLKPGEANVPYKSEGIYELKGDTLRFCSSDPGKPLPTGFKVEKDSDTSLIELERVPKGIRELKDLAGEWKYSAVQEGKELSTGTMDIYRDVIWITLGDKVEKAIVSLDSDNGFFDITPITGPIAAPAKPLLGRFTWKDDKLTIYSGLPGAERPAEAKTGKGVTVAVMVRAVKK